MKIKSVQSINNKSMITEIILTEEQQLENRKRALESLISDWRKYIEKQSDFAQQIKKRLPEQHLSNVEVDKGLEQLRVIEVMNKIVEEWIEKYQTELDNLNEVSK